MIRRVARGDARALQQFIRDLSPASRYRRFLTGDPRIARGYAGSLYTTRIRRAKQCWSLRFRRPRNIIGMAQYAGTDDVEGSEIAVVVDDAWQRQGLGYHLLDALINVAVEAGIERIHADVLADNHAMRATGAQALAAKSPPTRRRRSWSG